MKHKVLVIGVGRLGSRHLQALKKVKSGLEITVVDPSEASLRVAKKIYDTTPGTNHNVFYSKILPKNSGKIDIAIIATNADIRYKAATDLLRTTKVKYLILEKLLFTRKKDYFSFEKILKKNATRVWVNCTMRAMPFYNRLKNEVKDARIIYKVTGSKIRLITNTIHYLDHLAYLTDCLEYKLDTSLLEKTSIPSKRKGFIDYEGALFAKFENGSVAWLISYPDGDSPPIIEIASKDFICISREFERKAWLANSQKKWVFKEVPADIPFQSQMTAILVNDLLQKGTCKLVTYKDSMKIHLELLDPLLEHHNRNRAKKIDYFPFT